MSTACISARTIGANVNLLDVSRIEILKGPQGTLFGRNTIGGAISIVTRDPGETPMVEVEATTGSFNRRDINATADIPLASNLLSSLTVSSVQRDGYQKVIPYNNVNNYTFDPISPDTAGVREGGGVDTNDNFGGQNHQSVRGKLLYTPRQDLTLTLTADWTHQDQSATPNTVMQTFPNTPGSGGSIAQLYTLCLIGVPHIGQLCDLPRADGWNSHTNTPAGPGLPSLASSPNACADFAGRQRRQATSTRPMPTVPTTPNTIPKAWA